MLAKHLMMAGGGTTSLNKEKLYGYNQTQFVMSITNSVFDLSMANFPISQMILEHNDIKSKEEDLVGSPIYVDESVVSKMQYYRDSYGIYFYLEKSARRVHDDKVVESGKKAIVTDIPSDNETSSSYYAYTNVKFLLDDML
ncbi:hypothetical protein RYX36_035069 [Vicia faba]